MKSINNKQINDITFIGSGIATSFTLVAFLEEFNKDNSLEYPIKIAIIDKSQEFHTGLAYGPTSGSSALLITSLADFLPEGRERQEFLSWLADNKEHLINELREDGGSLSENWINTHAKDIENHTFEDVYLPRHFFGVFIKQKLEEIKKLNKLKKDLLDYFYGLIKKSNN